MSLITGSSNIARKQCLANLVKEHLIEIGHKAEIVTERQNSAGHTDRIAVESSIGLVHVTASGNLDPNGKIGISDYQGSEQTFLADKSYIAFGWNTQDGRTIITFVRAENIAGKTFPTKLEIQQLSERSLNKVITPKRAG